MAFPGDEVRTVAWMGWRSLTNGRLMAAAEPAFDVFVTLDQNLSFQNPVGKYTLGIVVLITRLNHIAAYRPRFSEIREMVHGTQPGQVNTLRLP